MAIQYNQVVTQSLAKQIAEQIRSAILNGDLQIDERLPTESELASRFNVSRPTIREALKRLAAQHLIRSRRGPAGGTFVNRPSREEMSDSLTGTATMMVSMGEFDLHAISEARREMERLCLKLAVERRTDAQLAEMAAALHQQQQPISDEDFCAADVRFHRALVDATSNPVLQFNMYTVIEALQPLTNMVANRFRERQFIIEHHQALYDAIAAQQLDSAEQALDALINHLTNEYEQALSWKQVQQTLQSGPQTG
ncbi:MAG: FadR family transcriptional regulator [Marinobacterium sp.]|nr:FadR family transcriptional regulator [Marinobacterium sp.]